MDFISFHLLEKNYRIRTELGFKSFFVFLLIQLFDISLELCDDKGIPIINMF